MPVDYEEKCNVCGHPMAEQSRIWGCGHCCPAPAPEVPSREPGKYWKGGVFHPAGNADVVRTVPRQPETGGHVQVVHANGEG